jgi:hypothetical protein
VHGPVRVVARFGRHRAALGTEGQVQRLSDRPMGYPEWLGEKELAERVERAAA